MPLFLSVRPHGLTPGSCLALALMLSLAACGEADGQGVSGDAGPPADSGWAPSPDAGPGWPSCETPDATSGFHATLQGTPEGDGSLASPWDLATALDRPPGVGPGDTIWIHGGRYAGAWVLKQDGAEGAPITIRAWPGDRVILDGAGASGGPVLGIYHQWIVVRDLEITNSDPDRRTARATGIWAGADHLLLVNLLVHDVGVGISGGQLGDDGVQQGTDILLYGCLFFNNGWLGEDRGHGHHVYLTNRDSVVRVEDNVIFYAYGSGIHNYSETDRNYVQWNEIIGNVWFGNGAPGGKLVDGCLVGHNGTLPVKDVLLRENYGYAFDLGGRDVRLGWGTPGENATLQDNYLVGLTIFQQEWTGVHLAGNTFVGALQGLDPADFPDNTFLDAPPVENVVVVRPNRYEPGRAHIIVYNWEGLDAVAVDLSDILPEGVSYEVRTVQDVLGQPVLSGTYPGGPLSLPMTGLALAQPVGDPEAIPAEQRTGKRFNVFPPRPALCD